MSAADILCRMERSNSTNAGKEMTSTKIITTTTASSASTTAATLASS
jgi:hypothetical protein